jgi:hypothetical protein
VLFNGISHNSVTPFSKGLKETQFVFLLIYFLQLSHGIASFSPLEKKGLEINLYQTFRH